MPRGFIYIVTSAKNYIQKYFYSVPTEWEDRLYFGPCKVSMRGKMKPDDYIFGVSPSSPKPRRILFATQIRERITYQEAYKRFPELRGPEGPIHVKPLDHYPISNSFPENKYEHIPGAMHDDECSDWKEDLARHALDAFFVCCEREDWFGKWLGVFGPEVDEEIFEFLQSCYVYGKGGRLRRHNTDATIENPIVYRNLTRGLHLEADNPEKLKELCDIRMKSNPPNFEEIRKHLPRKGNG